MIAMATLASWQCHNQLEGNHRYAEGRDSECLTCLYIFSEEAHCLIASFPSAATQWGWIVPIALSSELLA